MFIKVTETGPGMKRNENRRGIRERIKGEPRFMIIRCPIAKTGEARHEPVADQFPSEIFNYIVSINLTKFWLIVLQTDTV